MSRDSAAREYVPHDCPQCGGFAYIGGGQVPAVCVERGCVFFDEATYVKFTMLLDDDGMPRDSEPDFFDEDTNPGFQLHPAFKTQGTQTGRINPTAPGISKTLDIYGQYIGVARLPGESDQDFYDRLLGCYGRTP